MTCARWSLYKRMMPAGIRRVGLRESAGVRPLGLLIVESPFAVIRRRVHLPPQALSVASAASLVVSVLIVVGGGVVRVTGSGLGCPTWPECTAGSLSTTPELGIHGFIEFANRLLTTVLCIAVAAVIVCASLQTTPRRSITRPAWAQFWLVIINAVVGGITVLAHLNPWIVAAHFIAAMGMLTTATLTWHRVNQHSEVPSEGSSRRLLPRLTAALVVVTGVLILAGTLVTGSGPHSGDSVAVPRMGFDWTFTVIVHGLLGTTVLALGVVVAVILHRARPGTPAAARGIGFVVVVLAQAALGLVQSLTALPGALVALHLLGASLVWIGALRIALDNTPRRPPLTRGCRARNPNGARTFSTSDSVSD